jgi:hypothetical protein
VSAWKTLGTVLLVVVLAGCGSESEPEPDTTPPGIQSTVPTSDQTGVAPDTDIVIQFDEAIDRNSINDTIYHLEKGGQSLFGQVSYDLDLHQATLSLAIEFQAGQVYDAVLEPGVKDMAGNRRTETYRWSFTVAD